MSNQIIESTLTRIDGRLVEVQQILVTTNSGQSFIVWAVESDTMDIRIQQQHDFSFRGYQTFGTVKVKRVSFKAVLEYMVKHAN